MDFFGFLLSALVLTLIFKEPTPAPEELIADEPCYEDADPYYEKDVSFGDGPTVPVAEDYDTLQAEIEDFTQKYDKTDVTKEHIQQDTTTTLSPVMNDSYQKLDEVTVTAEQTELYGTAVTQADDNNTVTNGTSTTQTENMPLAVAINLIKLITFSLMFLNVALFIGTMLFMCKNDFKFNTIKYTMNYRMEYGDTESITIKYEDTVDIEEN